MKTNAEKNEKIKDIKAQIDVLSRELIELNRQDEIEVPYELLNSLGFKFKDSYWRKRREDDSEAVLDISDNYWDLELTTNNFYLTRDNTYGDSAESLIAELNRYANWPKLETFKINCTVGRAKLTGLEIEAWSDTPVDDLYDIVSEALAELDLGNLEKVVA